MLSSFSVQEEANQMGKQVKSPKTHSFFLPIQRKSTAENTGFLCQYSLHFSYFVGCFFAWFHLKTAIHGQSSCWFLPCQFEIHSKLSVAKTISFAHEDWGRLHCRRCQFLVSSQDGLTIAISYFHLEIREEALSTRTSYSSWLSDRDIRKTSTPSMLIRELEYQTSSSTPAKLQLRMVLSMFDISGKLITQKTFSEFTSFSNPVSRKKESPHLGLGFHDESRQRPALVFDDGCLVELDEKWPTKGIVSHTLTSEGKIVEMLTSSELIGDNYYSSVAYTRNTETFLKDPDNRILVMNLSSKEKALHQATRGQPKSSLWNTERRPIDCKTWGGWKWSLCSYLSISLMNLAIWLMSEKICLTLQKR